MRPALRSILCLVLLLATAWPAGGADTPASPAAKAIRRVLDEQVAAWNNKDLDKFMAGYWNSPQLTFFAGGTQLRGWKAARERYRKQYQAEGRVMGKLSFSDLAIDVLGPDSALVRGRWKLEPGKGKEALNGLFTLVFKRQPAGWRIVHDHTSRTREKP